MKIKRELSGAYFRVLNQETGKYENRTFEDMEEFQQDELLSKTNHEFAKNMVKHLAKTINRFAEEFDIIAGDETIN